MKSQKHKITISNPYYKASKDNLITILTPEQKYLAESNIKVNNNDVLCEAKITNYHDKPKNIILFAAVYNKDDNGNLVLKNVSKCEQAVGPYDYRYFKINAKKNENEVLKLFLWDDNLVPILDVKSQE